MFDYHQILFKREKGAEKYLFIGLFWVGVGFYGYCCLLRVLGL